MLSKVQSIVGAIILSSAGLISGAEASLNPSIEQASPATFGIGRRILSRLGRGRRGHQNGGNDLDFEDDDEEYSRNRRQMGGNWQSGRHGRLHGRFGGNQDFGGDFEGGRSDSNYDY
ncbi:hypothetical protein DSO57_1006791 [Entomophthora muscae]|uniref:Uncharacterized protein n=2 Tax=Entomophthora muscae TaxID=34485 RepID=A0ACC2S9E8_9FUNG|nr:hypothetical protein DSO57_1006790 [Entomophthora muscae]KAJ9059017.1 hypothetical protein DSO57_1006791 [Entomophthora muscae]